MGKTKASQKTIDIKLRLSKLKRTNVSIEEIDSDLFEKINSEGKVKYTVSTTFDVDEELNKLGISLQSTFYVEIEGQKKEIISHGSVTEFVFQSFDGLRLNESNELTWPTLLLHDVYLAAVCHERAFVDSALANTIYGGGKLLVPYIPTSIFIEEFKGNKVESDSFKRISKAKPSQKP